MSESERERPFPRLLDRFHRMKESGLQGRLLHASFNAIAYPIAIISRKGSARVIHGRAWM